MVNSILRPIYPTALDTVSPLNVTIGALSKPESEFIGLLFAHFYQHNQTVHQGLADVNRESDWIFRRKYTLYGCALALHTTNGCFQIVFTLYSATLLLSGDFGCICVKYTLPINCSMSRLTDAEPQIAGHLNGHIIY